MRSIHPVELGAGKLERITVGNNIWTGAGKRSDAMMRTRARISTLLLCEIKRHDTKLLQSAPYRAPDVYAPSNELVGGTAQLQKTVQLPGPDRSHPAGRDD